MWLMKRRDEPDETPQDEYDLRRSSRIRDYFDSTQDIMQDIADWAHDGRGRTILIGLLAIVIALVWCVVIVLVFTGGEPSSPEYVPVEQIRGDMSPSAGS